MGLLFSERKLIKNTLIECAFFNFDEPLVICFNPAGKVLSSEQVNAKLHAWCYDFMFKQKINVIAINTVSENHWFLCPELEDYLKSLEDVIARFPQRLGYGVSMGAFGVSKYSQLLKIDRALLYSPLLPKDSNFSILPSLVDTEWNIVFDPFCAKDKEIAEQYPTRTRYLHFYGVGHQVIESIAKIGYLKSLYLQFYKKEIDNVEFYRQQRKKKKLIRYYSYMDRNPTTKNTLRRKVIIKKYKVIFILKNFDQLYKQVKNRLVKSIRRRF